MKNKLLNGIYFPSELSLSQYPYSCQGQGKHLGWNVKHCLRNRVYLFKTIYATEVKCNRNSSIDWISPYKKYKMALHETAEGLLFLTVNNKWKKIKLLQVCIKRIVWVTVPLINEKSKLGCL